MQAPETLPTGATLKVILAYTGRFRDNLEGFYRAKYQSEDGEHQFALTFMEPTCARQVRSLRYLGLPLINNRGRSFLASTSRT